MKKIVKKPPWKLLATMFFSLQIQPGHSSEIIDELNKRFREHAPNDIRAINNQSDMAPELSTGNESRELLPVVIPSPPKIGDQPEQSAPASHEKGDETLSEIDANHKASIDADDDANHEDMKNATEGVQIDTQGDEQMIIEPEATPVLELVVETKTDIDATIDAGAHEESQPLEEEAAPEKEIEAPGSGQQASEDLRETSGEVVAEPVVLARVDIQDRSGVAGLANQIADMLEQHGYKVVGITAHDPIIKKPTNIKYRGSGAEIVSIEDARYAFQEKTMIYYRIGFSDHAKGIGHLLPDDQQVLKNKGLASQYDIELSLGFGLAASLGADLR